MCIRALASAAQDGSLPLHVAAANQAAEAVVVELLKAHAGAAAEKDEVCPSRSHLCAAEYRLRAYADSPARFRAAQEGRLPLHVAVQHQASEAVVRRLLAAGPDVAKESHLRPCVVLPPACLRGLTRSPSRCAG